MDSERLSSQCIFCQIIAKKSPAYIVYEDNEIIAFLDKYPISEGHTLVLPKKHYARFDEIPEELLSKLFLKTQLLNSEIKAKLQATGSHVTVNDGKAANQLVPHVHVHLIPRNEDDNVSFVNRKKLTPELMESIRQKISLLRKID